MSADFTIAPNTLRVHVERNAYNARYAQPIHVPVFDFAVPKMKAYWADLAHDMLDLGRAEPGDRFLLMVRQHGTQLWRMFFDRSEEEKEIAAVIDGWESLGIRFEGAILIHVIRDQASTIGRFPVGFVADVRWTNDAAD